MQVQSRMHELNGSLGVCDHMYMICAPRAARSVLAAQLLGPRYLHAQVYTTLSAENMRAKPALKNLFVALISAGLRSEALVYLRPLANKLSSK